MSIRPSGVRARIRKEHDELRAKLDELEAALQRLAQAGRDAIPEIVVQARHLYGMLRDHIDLEDAILAPALRDADAWGPVRADDLIRHHREQRLQLQGRAEADAATVDPRELGARVHAFIQEVRLDMNHEENALLDPQLLRDDVISIDSEGG